VVPRAVGHFMADEALELAVPVLKRLVPKATESQTG
jgi:hypothetical protein